MIWMRNSELQCGFNYLKASNMSALRGIVSFYLGRLAFQANVES
jgi:hypothetical protein